MKQKINCITKMNSLNKYVIFFLPVFVCLVSTKTGSGDSGINPHNNLSLPPVTMRPFGRISDLTSTVIDTT